MAVLADAFYDHPTQKLHLIGITGTNGKTTTSHLIEKIFLMSKPKNRFNRYDVYENCVIRNLKRKIQLLRVVMLQKAFKQMLEANVDTAIMEVSSHA